jgi:hypothetical protein
MNSSTPAGTGYQAWPQYLGLRLPALEIHWVVYMVFAAWLSSYLIHYFTSPAVDVPFVGYRSPLEPTWFVRLRFVWKGGSIVSDGYKKVSTSAYRHHHTLSCWPFF